MSDVFEDLLLDAAAPSAHGHHQRLTLLARAERIYNLARDQGLEVRRAMSAVRQVRAATLHPERARMVESLVDIFVDEYLDVHELPDVTTIVADYPSEGVPFLNELRAELLENVMDALHGDALALVKLWQPDPGHEAAERAEAERGRAADDAYETMRDRRDGRG